LFSGQEGEPVGNLYFAGEHCSRDFQGFMNGGAMTGRLAAAAILAESGAAVPWNRPGAAVSV
jgi:monoamine oxidase